MAIGDKQAFCAVTDQVDASAGPNGAALMVNGTPEALRVVTDVPPVKGPATSPMFTAPKSNVIGVVKLGVAVLMPLPESVMS